MGERKKTITFSSDFSFNYEISTIVENNVPAITAESQAPVDAAEIDTSSELIKM